MRHGSFVFASTILVNAFNYLFHVVISRKIGVESYGALSSMIALFTVVSIPASIGQTIVAKYTAEFWAAGEIDRLRASMSGVLRAFFIASVAATALFAVASPTIGRALQIGDTPALLLFSLAIGANVLLPLLRGALQGRQDFGSYAVSIASEACGKALLGIVLVYAGFGLLGAVGGFAAGSLIALAYTTLACNLRFGKASRSEAPLDLRRLLQTAGGVSIATSVLTVIGFADILLVKHFLSPSAAGIYGAVSLIGKILFFVAAFVPTIILPKATHLAAIGRAPKMLLLEAALALGATSGVGLALFSVFPARIVEIVAGSSFAQAALYIFPYGAAMMLLAATSVAVSYKIGLHRFDFVIPLIVVAVGEIATIIARHATLDQVIQVILIGHGAAFVGSLYRITMPLPTLQRLPLTKEVA